MATDTTDAGSCQVVGPTMSRLNELTFISRQKMEDVHLKCSTQGLGTLASWDPMGFTTPNLVRICSEEFVIRTSQDAQMYDIYLPAAI